MSRPVAQCDKITMEIVRTWESSSEAGRFLRKAPDNIRDSCNRQILPRGKYVYRYLDDVDPNEVFTGPRHRPIKITDLDTGEVHTFYSIQEAAKNLMIPYKTITMGRWRKNKILGKYVATYAR